MASTPTDRDLSEACFWLGVDSTEDNMEQMRVLAQAMVIYEEREAARGGLWKEAGAIDSAHHLKSKGMRVFVAATHPEEAGREAGIDEAVDAVNYAAFFVRNYRAGRVEST